MSQIHPREKIVEDAEADFLDFWLHWVKRYNLTFGEMLRILTDRLGSIHKYLIRSEHHPNKLGKQGGIKMNEKPEAYWCFKDTGNQFSPSSMRGDKEGVEIWMKLNDVVIKEGKPVQIDPICEVSQHPDTVRAKILEELLRDVLNPLGLCEHFDHHGYCQTHFIEDPCSVGKAWKFLAIDDAIEKNPMKKEETYWGVKDPEGNLWLNYYRNKKDAEEAMEYPKNPLPKYSVVLVEINEKGKHPDTVRLEKLEEILKRKFGLERDAFLNDVSCCNKPICQAIDEVTKEIP